MKNINVELSAVSQDDSAVHTSTSHMHDAGRVAYQWQSVMPHIKRRKFASENSVASYSLFAVVMRYYPAAEANQMAESWVTRLESLSAEHAAKYRRGQEEEERKKRTGKGERRGNGTINELPGLDYGHALFCIFNVTLCHQSASRHLPRSHTS